MQIGWVDYSKEERDKVISIFNLLSGQESLDELGIGGVRDAFSDLLFPGISVLQRRAKYFVLLPYMFYDALHEAQAERLHSGKEVRDFIDKRENRIVYTLINNSEYNAPGIVGRRNIVVETKPSAMYWNGLKVFGILTEPSFSIDNACNAIYSKGRLHSKTERKNETEESGADDADINNDGFVVFNSINPRYPYMKEASIDLNLDEAKFLQERILHAEGTKDSALPFLLKNYRLLYKYESFDDFRYHDFPSDLAYKVRLAREFADFIYGAHLLYNIIYADGCGFESDTINKIKQEFKYYKQTYKSPSIDEIIHVSKPKGQTGKFIRDFNSAMSNGDIETAKAVVINREIEVKKARSKLLRPADHQFTKTIHHFKLSYRYDRARDILMDIVNGLGRAYE